MTNKDLLEECKITLFGYEAKKSSFDPIKNNHRRPYYNEKNDVAIIWDNFNIIIEFNPTIYMLGQNVTMCTLDECVSAVKRLSSEVGTDLFQWDIVGYDWNVTIEVTYPCAAYLPLLQEHRRYKRVTDEYKTGKHYENGGKSKNRTFTAYNKIHECTKKKIIIPSSMTGKNLFRIEHSIINKLRDYKRFETVKTVADFLTAHNWNNAADLFWGTYEEIRKHEILCEPSSFSTPEYFTSTQRGKLLDIRDAGGIDKYIIKQKVLVGKEEMKQRRFKAKIKAARRIWNEYATGNQIAEKSLLQELNDKVGCEVDRLKII